MNISSKGITKCPNKSYKSTPGQTKSDWELFVSEIHNGNENSALIHYGLTGEIPINQLSIFEKVDDNLAFVSYNNKVLTTLLESNPEIQIKINNDNTVSLITTDGDNFVEVQRLTEPIVLESVISQFGSKMLDTNGIVQDVYIKPEIIKNQTSEKKYSLTNKIVNINSNGSKDIFFTIKARSGNRSLKLTNEDYKDKFGGPTIHKYTLADFYNTNPTDNFKYVFFNKDDKGNLMLHYFNAEKYAEGDPQQFKTVYVDALLNDVSKHSKSGNYSFGSFTTKQLLPILKQAYSGDIEGATIALNENTRFNTSSFAIARIQANPYVFQKYLEVLAKMHYANYNEDMSSIGLNMKYDQNGNKVFDYYSKEESKEEGSEVDHFDLSEKKIVLNNARFVNNPDTIDVSYLSEFKPIISNKSEVVSLDVTAEAEEFVKDFNNFELKQISNSIVDYVLNNILEGLRRSNPNLEGMTDVQLLNALGDPIEAFSRTKKYLKRVLKNKTITPEQSVNLKKVIAEAFIGDKLNTENPIGLHIIKTFESSTGISIKSNKASLSEKSEDVVNNDDSKEDKSTDNNKELESWIQDDMHKLASDKIRPQVANKLRYLKSTGRNIIGLSNYYSVTEVQNILISTLVNSKNEADMLQKLRDNEYAYPFFKEVLKLIDRPGQEQFRAQFYASFANAKVNFISGFLTEIKEKTGEVYKQLSVKIVGKSLQRRLFQKSLTATFEQSKKPSNTSWEEALGRQVIAYNNAKEVNTLKAKQDYAKTCVKGLEFLGFNFNTNLNKLIDSLGAEELNNFFTEIHYFTQATLSPAGDIINPLNAPDLIEQDKYGSKKNKMFPNKINDLLDFIIAKTNNHTNGSIYSNAERKVKSTIITPTYLTNLYNELQDPITAKSKLEELKADRIQYDPIKGEFVNLILRGIDEELKKDNPNLSKFKFAVLDSVPVEMGADGKSDEVKEYSDLNAVELLIHSLNTYDQSHEDLPTHYTMYRGPVLSDSKICIYASMLTDLKRARKHKLKNGTEEDQTQRLTDLAKEDVYKMILAEYYRILKNKENNSGVKNYESVKDLTTGFIMFPFMNNIYNSILSNPEELKKFNSYANEDSLDKLNPENNSVLKSTIMDGINNYIEKETNELFNMLVNGYSQEMVISNKYKNYLNNALNPVESSSKQVAINAIKDELREYALSSLLFKYSFNTLTVGDPAFYKKDKQGSVLIDFFKRAKEIFSPKQNSNIDASYVDKYGVKHTVFDALGHGDGKIHSIILMDETADPNKKSIKDIEAITEKLVKDKVLTKEARAKIISNFKVKDPKDRAKSTDGISFITPQFFRITQISMGRWNHAKEAAYNRILEGKERMDDAQLIMFNQQKPYSFTKIWNKITVSETPVQYKNSEVVLFPSVATDLRMNMMLKHMQDQNIHIAHFDSAVKVGNQFVTTLDKFAETGKATTLATKFQDRGQQQEMPEHFLDTMINIGTQIKKLVFLDIDSKDEFALKKFQEYENVMEEMLKLCFDNVKERFQNLDGTVNYESLSDLLISESTRLGYDPSYAEAFALNEDKTGFKFPLYHPIHTEKSEYILTAIFKNNITNQKINGGQFAQCTEVIVSDELGVVETEQGGIAIEVMLPFMSRKYFMPFMDKKTGQIDMERIKREAPQLLEGIGYRVPTEANYSFPPIIVKGFLPQQMCGTVVVPTELMTMSGSDLDIDKLFIMFRNWKLSKGKVELYEIISEDAKFDDKVKHLQNKIFNIYNDVLTHPNNVEKMLQKGGFETLTAIRNKDYKGVGIETDVFSESATIKAAIRNNEGKSLIGLAANFNAIMPLLQMIKPEISKSSKFIKFDGEIHTNLFKNLTDTNGNKISKWVNEILAAVVDNAKDPLLGDLNYNEHTAGVYTTLLFAGVELETVVHFMAHPAIVNLIKAFDKSKSNNLSDFTERYLFKEFKVKPEKSTGMITKKGLLNNTYIDPNIISDFSHYLKLANDLGKFVNLTQADRKGIKKTYVEAELFNLEYNTAQFSNIDGLNKALDGTNIRFVKMFTEYGIKQPLDLLRGAMGEGRLFLDTSRNILDLLPKSKVNQSTFKDIRKSIKDFMANQFGFIQNNTEGLDKEYLKDLFEENVTKVKDGKPYTTPFSLNTKQDLIIETTIVANGWLKKVLKDNLFLNNLMSKKEMVGDLFTDVLYFYRNGGLSAFEQSKIKEDFALMFDKIYLANEILKSNPNLKQKELDAKVMRAYNTAKLLLKYQFAKFGVGFNKEGFFELITPEIYNEIILDKDGKSLTDHFNSFISGENQFNKEGFTVDFLFDKMVSKNPNFITTDTTSIPENNMIKTGDYKGLMFVNKIKGVTTDFYLIGATEKEFTYSSTPTEMSISGMINIYNSRFGLSEEQMNEMAGFTDEEVAEIKREAEKNRQSQSELTPTQSTTQSNIEQALMSIPVEILQQSSIYQRNNGEMLSIINEINQSISEGVTLEEIINKIKECK